MNFVNEMQDTTLTPFGNPDGARAELDGANDGFVQFGSGWGGLSTRSDDLSARVLVGRKGSGKTLYLRRLQAHAAKEDSLYADEIQQDVPPTELIIRFGQLFGVGTKACRENWNALWHRAIVLSLVSHLLCHDVLKEKVPEDDKNKIRDTCRKLTREDFGAHLSVYSQVTSIIRVHHTKSTVADYFNHPAWSELVVHLGKTLAKCPPICFYIDAVDEEFEAAPRYWLECQKGLFHETFDLLRKQALGGRLHIFTCIRDIVYSAILRGGEHQGRYRGEAHIRVLSWTKGSIEYFLQQKLCHLDPSFILKENARIDPISEWLGAAQIENKRRRVRENVTTYLLRHTRLIPRDIVYLGNELSLKMVDLKRTGNKESLQSIIRITVSKAAKGFGDEQLEICANEMMSNQIPPHAVHQGYAEAYIKNKDYAVGLKDYIVKLISSVGEDRFSSKKFDQAQKFAEELFGEGTDALGVLWRNGLIGYADGSSSSERHIFYSDDNLEDFRVPRDKKIYLFHPILIDSVGIRSTGGRPIVPFA
jgi:hypothetical protein